MKVVQDEDLSVLHKETQQIAKEISRFSTEEIIHRIEELFKENKYIRSLDYSGIVTFINTIGTHFFCHLFKYSSFIGRQFPDASHCERELFEEVHAGLRILLNMPEINKNEYVGGIKKIHLNKESN